jgi:hypothetical protein
MEESHGMKATAGNRLAEPEMTRTSRCRQALSSLRPLVTGVALLSLILLVFLGAQASAAEPPEPPVYVSSFGPDGTESSDFTRINSLAVDQQTGYVYVLDAEAGVLYKFEADGQPLDWGGTSSYISANEISGLEPYAFFKGSQIAVDSATHIVYVTEKHSVRAFHEDGEPAEFTAGPGANTKEIPGFTELSGVAVDVNGAIYASDRAGGVSVFAPTGELLTTLNTGTVPTSLAVNSSGAVYVLPLEGFESIKKAVPDQFPVTSATAYSVSSVSDFSTGSPIGINIDPVTNNVYIVKNFSGTARVREYDESGNFITSFGEVSDTVGEFGPLTQGIAVVGGGKEFQFYLGNSGGDTSKVETFGQPVHLPMPPTVESTSAVNVTADSAKLRAKVNPNTLDTTYHFEYGPEDCSTTTCATVTPASSGIGSGHKGVFVFSQLVGLQAGTTYHYRVVAENALGTTEGPDRTFTTQVSALGFQLSDSRAWEMVSPPDKHGGELLGSSLGQIQAAADGNGLAYLSFVSVEADPDGTRDASSILARRSPAGWRSKDITPPTGKVTPVQNGGQSEYKLFSNDLSKALLDARGHTPLSPQASERTPYLRQNSEPAEYTPLVTGKEGFANVPPGTEFGGEAIYPVRVLGANIDFSHVVLISEVPLAAGAPEIGLYEWMEGQLRPLSVLPASEGGAMTTASVIGSDEGSVEHAISDEGSRVFWGTGGSSAESLNALYLRDTGSEETVRLDLVQQGASGSGKIQPNFQGASADGTVVFFKDSQQLTDDASPEGSDLYRCEIPAGASATGCATLTDVSVPLGGPGESGEVQGLAAGVSDDGSRIYFVAEGVLDTAPNDSDETATAGEPNLYLWQQGEGARFIATLSDRDSNDWGGESAAAGKLSAAHSPSGRYLSFMSERSLTGYDNHDAASGELDQEAFRYDAEADVLACVSCNPSGASPAGVLKPDEESPVDPHNQWRKRWVAATLPQATVQSLTGASLYRPRAVLDNGRVFFNAADALVPADSNGQWDVYQYESTGVGSCTASTGGAAASRLGDGCVSMISSGTAGQEAAFLDAGASGDDVFFLSTARLSVLEEDTVYDIYDARVNGVPERLTPRTECLGEACQPVPVAPNDPTPASASFKGAGNEAATRCPKGKKRRLKNNGTSRCVALKHKKHPHKAKRAASNRRASR